MKKIKWKAINSSITGRIHGQDEMQDATKSYVRDGIVCLVMSDGASSADYAAEGSRLVCNTVYGLAREMDVELLELDAAALTGLLADRIRGAVEERAAQRQTDPGEFSATMAMFICTPERYVAVNVGDGLIAAVADGGSPARVILEPEQGRFANTCRFATERHAADYMYVARGKLSLSETYVMMTDGSASCLYNYATGALAPALGKFTEHLRHNDRVFTSAAVRRAMRARFTQFTSDDCTLMMLRGDEVDAPDTADGSAEGR